MMGIRKVFEWQGLIRSAAHEIGENSKGGATDPEC
jgi:hypothetical protein